MLAAIADLLGPGATIDLGGDHGSEMLAWLGAAAVLSGVLAYVGAMVGLVLGQFRLPLLLLALGSAPAAAATNLAISSLGAGTGAYTHSREGRVELRLLLSIGAPSAAAAYLTSRSLDKVEAWWIGVVIGLTLLVSALPLARKSLRLRREEQATVEKVEVPVGEEGHARTKRLLAIEIVIGAALGALSGVVGLLLGTLRLPAMLRLGVSPQKAAGTNMAIGFFTGVAGALGAVGSGRVSWLALAVVGVTTVLGAFLGARRTKVLPVAWHYGLIAVVLIVVAAWLIGNSILAGRA